MCQKRRKKERKGKWEGEAGKEKKERRERRGKEQVLRPERRSIKRRENRWRAMLKIKRMRRIRSGDETGVEGRGR